MAQEVFAYDAAGNVTSAPDSSFLYDTNNRLISWGGNAVSYDLDGNMLSNGSLSCTYDSANRLVSAGGHTYTYNAEDVRIRNLCADEDTTYTYSTNAKLSMLLMKTTNGVVTKYVYGKGLIGEEVNTHSRPTTSIAEAAPLLSPMQVEILPIPSHTIPMVSSLPERARAR